jgi:hypothetical protein
METEHIEIQNNLRYIDKRYSNRSWPLRNDHILELFGLPPNSPIPPNHRDEKRIGNIKVFIVPQGTIHIKRRVVAQCPNCYKLVCAGHLFQHLKVHNRKSI